MWAQRAARLTDEVLAVLTGGLLIIAGVPVWWATAIGWGPFSRTASGPAPPAEDVLRHVGADGTSLDIRATKCEKLVEAVLWGTDDITVRWEDGPEDCAPVGGMEILVGDEVFRLWWCSLPSGIEFDWRNIERGDCNE